MAIFPRTAAADHGHPLGRKVTAEMIFGEMNYRRMTHRLTPRKLESNNMFGDLATLLRHELEFAMDVTVAKGRARCAPSGRSTIGRKGSRQMDA